MLSMNCRVGCDGAVAGPGVLDPASMGTHGAEVGKLLGSTAPALPAVWPRSTFSGDPSEDLGDKRGEEDSMTLWDECTQFITVEWIRRAPVMDLRHVGDRGCEC